MISVQELVASYQACLTVCRTLQAPKLNNKSEVFLPDGTRVVTASNGKVSYVEYSGGTIIKKLDAHTIVRTECGEFWVFTNKGLIFRLD